MTKAKFVLWQSTKDKLWYWHLKSTGNNKVVCWAEGYSTKQDALDSINWVYNNAGSATLEDLSK
jgi:uncharacterized protein YegP (UPF0339 family)